MLFIVRHAWAEELGEEFPNDEARPLTKAGRKRFKKIVKRLVKRGFGPTQIATSPLLRCRETAEIIAEYAPGKPAIAELDALKPGSSLDALLEWTRQQTGGDVAWVGHAPDVEELAAGLIGASPEAIAFSKGAIAAIEFDGAIEAGKGQLVWLVTAETLGR